MPQNTTNHTPGPWDASGNTIYAAHRCVATTEGFRVASREADARLIAAAPDLLMVAKIDDAFQRLGYTQAAVAELEAHGITVPLTPPYGLDLAAFQKEVRRTALSKAEAR